VAGDRTVVLRDGTTLWTTASGSGPPVVLCHGGPGLWDYLGSLAALLEDRHTVVRFDQRGCGRSGGGAPFTLAQAVDDLDQVRAAYGLAQWTVVGHSWGAELVLRYAAQHPQRVTAVGYLAGIGAGNDFHERYVATRAARLGADLERWEELRTRARTADEEREFCLLQWRPDFAPADAAAHAQALWDTRPDGAEINAAANAQLWTERATDDLLQLAGRVTCPVLMLFGRDDPRPWDVTTPVFDALPRVERVVLDDAGHAPWVEQPETVRRILAEFLGATRGETEGSDVVGR
jgi:proline iminopeptidase